MSRPQAYAYDVKEMKKMQNLRQQLPPSPCLTCTRVKDPANCENKNCQVWGRWFAQRWASIHGYYEKYARKEEEK